MTEDQREPLEGREPLDFNLDRNALYLEETYTDLRLGTVKRYMPVNADGTPDKARKPVFVGQTSIYTPHGPLPIQSVIHAKELSQAFKRFPEAMQQALQRMMEEAEKIRDTRESPIVKAPESRIIIP